MQGKSQPVFVCYARADGQFVVSLANHLRTRGIDVWLDQWAIQKGIDWDRAIDDALTRCVCLLVILSPSSVESEEVRGELRTALDSGKPIVPVLFRPCRIPRRLRLRQYIDISSAPDASDSIASVESALREALSAPDRSPGGDLRDTERTAADARTQPGFIDGLLRRRAGAPQQTEVAQSFVAKLRLWGRERPYYLLALGLPTVGFASWQLFRLPIVSEDLRYPVVFATGVLCVLLLLVGSRAGAVLLAAGIGGAFVLKPWLVPLESSGGVFAYSSETAMTYWVPGAAFFVFAMALVLISSRHRLGQDFGRLRPRVGAIIIGAAMALAAYLYFKSPTLYDVYLPFRPRYSLLREHLRTVASTLDAVKPPVPASRQLEVPLVLDQSSRVRDEDSSTTGHILLYQHLTEPDSYFGDIEYAFNDDLHLHIRDTGADPVLYAPAFATFASEGNARSLEHTLEAPYLVVVKPLSLVTSRRVDKADLARAGPYRVFLYHLKRDEILYAADVDTPVTTLDELKEGVYTALDRSVGAKVLR